MALQDIRARLQGQDPTRRNLRNRLEQIGGYNATHRHGEPMKALGGFGGQPQGAGLAIHDHSLDLGGKTVNRANAPMGQAVQGVQMYTPQGQPIPGVPAGVTPTKPPPYQQQPAPVGGRGPIQGSDALTGLQPAALPPRAPGVAGVPYPIRRPQSGPPSPASVINRKPRRNWG